MVVMFRMTPEKKRKWAKETEKMIEVLEEFKRCLESSDDYEDDEEDWNLEDSPQFKYMMKRAMKSAMKSRYSKNDY